MSAKAKGKISAIGRWLARVLGAAAPFVPDPKTKVIVGAAAAVLDAATDKNDDADKIVEKGDAV